IRPWESSGAKAQILAWLYVAAEAATHKKERRTSRKAGHYKHGERRPPQRASESEWPWEWNCLRASSKVGARTEKITARVWRPMKWKRHSCWTSFGAMDIERG